MQTKQVFLTAALTLCGVAGALATAQSAAAAPALAGAVRAETQVTPVILTLRCYTRHGVSHCRWIDGAVRPYKWYDPNRYPIGSTAWWRAMDRESRGGFRR